MIPKVNIGDKIFHKHLGIVTVINLTESGIRADTDAHGVLEFSFYDFGKVLYFKKDHSKTSYKTYDEYINSCEKIIVVESVTEGDIEQDRENRRLRILERNHLKTIEIERDRERQIKQYHEENRELYRNIQGRISEKEKMLSDDHAKNMDNDSSNRIFLTRSQKYHNRRILEILERRKIEHLVHFTRIENLLSVLENGLVPVSLQKESNICSIRNDEKRLDLRLNCTSCSVEFPNYLLLYTFKNKYPDSRWVVIKINTEVLTTHNNHAYYHQSNAAGTSNLSKLIELRSSISFEKMFCVKIQSKENRIIARSELQINDHYTTDPQAEILISEIIDPKNFECVCFNYQIDLDEFVMKNGRESLAKIKYSVDPEIFAARKDHLIWKKVH